MSDQNRLLDITYVEEVFKVEAVTAVWNLSCCLIGARPVFEIRLLFEIYILLDVFTDSFNNNSHIEDSLNMLYRQKH
jgi:hypothetical protein